MASRMSIWNGHYQSTCYHPLFVFNQFGDLERCALRPGNVHSADGWEDVLKPVILRYRGRVWRIYFRADAAFAMPASTNTWRLNTSNTRSVCPPTRSFRTGSAICSSAQSDGRRRTRSGGIRQFHLPDGKLDEAAPMIAKVEWHPGELYPRVGFIVTDVDGRARRCL